MSNEEVLELVEIKMNKWANDICTNYRIRPNSFKITIKQNKEHLKPTAYGYMVQDGSYHDYMHNDKSSITRAKRTYIVRPNDLLDSHSQVLATVSNGSIVQITLFVPLIAKEDNLQKHLNKTVKRMQATCKRLFKYLSNPRLHRDSELFNPTIVGDTLHELLLGESNTTVWRRRKFNIDVKNDLHRSQFQFSQERKVTVTHRDSGIECSITDYEGVKSEWELRDECWDKCSMLVNEKLYGVKQYRSTSVALVKYGHYNTLVHPLWD